MRPAGISLKLLSKRRQSSNTAGTHPRHLPRAAAVSQNIRNTHRFNNEPALRQGAGSERRHSLSLHATFGSFHQLDLHHFLRDGFPPADVESDQRSRLLQRLHGSAVGHVPNIHLVDSQDDVIDPETEREHRAVSQVRSPASIETDDVTAFLSFIGAKAGSRVKLRIQTYKQFKGNLRPYSSSSSSSPGSGVTDFLHYE